jgi:nucleoside triphosphate diphosphatase
MKEDKLGDNEKRAGELFQEFVHLVATLNSKGGCPWDQEQTHESIKPYLLEETHEVIEAINRNVPAEIREELGDLLLQVVFLSRKSEELGDFDITDVVKSIIHKMTIRHPHVFGDIDVENADEVLVNWEKIKKKTNEPGRSILAGIPPTLPGLLRARRVQEKAARVGFDWDKIDDVRAKIDEEIAEFDEALKNKDRVGMEDELGDLLFTFVNISRFLEVNPEEALRKTIGKFTSRFGYIEKHLHKEGLEFDDVSLDQMEELWQKAKEETSIE